MMVYLMVFICRCMKDDGTSTCTGVKDSSQWPSWAVYVIAGGAAAVVFLAFLLTVCVVLRRKNYTKDYDCQSEKSELEQEFDPYGRFNKRGSYFRCVVNPLYDETNSSTAYQLQEVLDNYIEGSTVNK
ncbi:uncharacterized protein LOC118431720 isoform X1 [Branchiostoma floridae]|uniref:Uncharacterized protein LOC118431720 isoform X1 n=1 Tax=Branchiostoma floridae TaxID=7739 RepID=A0A9J7NDB6_BRAFL|nr:uncharacterized protein LOC118431720 isoform X1 [Branchiostoma floridae]